MNCWFWIILLWCFCGKGGCQNDCMCTRDRDFNRGRDRDNDSARCESVFPAPVSSCPPPSNGCGCGSEMVQTRSFAGFGDNNTCGCEEKED